MMRLSFILPCYNVERYIGDCLESIYAQNLSEEEFEVICVNDCSTDGTRDVILHYQQAHANLQLIDHTQNLTAGGARNTGIEHANGEYIWFVDPDDMIKKNVCSCLLRKVSDYNADILMFNNDTIDETGKNIGEEHVFIDSECKNGQRFIEIYFPMHMSTLCIIWRCIFSRRFILQYGLRYPQMRKSQDVVFLWKSLLCANSVASVSDSYYIYRCNPYSVAKLSDKAEVIFSEYMLQSWEIVRMLNGDVKSDLLLKDMRQTIRWHVNHISALFQMPEKEILKYYNLINKNKEKIVLLYGYMSRKVLWLYRNPLSAVQLRFRLNVIRLLNKMKLTHIG